MRSIVNLGESELFLSSDFPKDKLRRKTQELVFISLVFSQLSFLNNVKLGEPKLVFLRSKPQETVFHWSFLHYFSHTTELYEIQLLQIF